jgi:uncharacterized protein YdhG (YjbR/CyaY superfamily)
MMDKKKPTFTTIDEYIAAQPQALHTPLNTLRETIQAAAPDATEKISYGMPTFYLLGNLVHFGAAKHHIGFYPAPSGLDAFTDDLAPYQSGKGTARFPLEEPMPLELIRRIVEYRVDENLKKAAHKKKKPR